MNINLPGHPMPVTRHKAMRCCTNKWMVEQRFYKLLITSSALYQLDYAGTIDCTISRYLPLDNKFHHRVNKSWSKPLKSKLNLETIEDCTFQPSLFVKEELPTRKFVI